MKMKTLLPFLITFLNVAIAGEIVTYESDGYGFNTKSYFYISGDQVIAICL